GAYDAPKVRLPGGGGAPEIAIHCREIFITMAMGSRAFVETLPFITSFGHGAGKGDRARLGLTTRGPTKVITDLCVMEPADDTAELSVVSLHPGVTREQVQAGCGWKLRFASDLTETPAATEAELGVLRDLQLRTKRAHGVAA
ncbi:MAG: CoA-transferase, partial [Bosea sp. (in: a-proteobacteria)]